ncbi:MAG: TonB-dependent receptor [Acidobacteriota bacterium]|nr:TonB-dependent receptor [Acidobacteriota bacterium]
MNRILLSLIMSLCTAVSAFSQTQANTGQIEGFVIDPAGANIANAIVKIRNTDTNQTREVTTNEEGLYRASLLQIGSYEITVESSGFALYTQSGISLSTGQILTINPRLAVAGLQNEVSVVADANVIESSRTNISRAVNQIDVTELPNLSSSELNYAFLQPFVSGDPPREYEAPRLDFGGLSRRLNYQVDGFQNSSAQQKAFRVIIFSTAALQETQIGTYGATAESGRTGGPGVINNIIRSGTNKFSGTVRYQTYRKAFNALPYGALPGNEPNGNTFVGAIGGPIKRDKLFFFASYEASKRAFPQSLGFTSDAARANTARLGFTGDEISVLPSNFNPQLWLAKLDWRPNSTHSITIRGNTFREFFAARDPGGTTVLSSSNGAIFNEAAGALSWIAIVSPRVVNEFRAQLADRYTTRRPVVEPTASTLPRTVVSGVATFGFPSGLTANREKIIEFSDNVSFQASNHQLKFGTNIVRSPLQFTDQLIPTFTFGGLSAFAGGSGRPARPAVTALDNYFNTRAGLTDPATNSRYTYTTLTTSFGDPGLNYDITYYGLYAQDEWRVRPNFTLNYGLRWETLNPPLSDETSPYELSRQFNTDRNNFAPRLGFAWSPGRDGKTVLRGSYGLHYDAPQGNYYRDALAQNGQRIFTATIAGTTTGAPAYPNIPTSAAGLSAVRSSITIFDPNFVWMYVNQVQLSVERALAEDMALQVSYAFTKGTKIPIVQNINLAPPVGTLADGRNLYSTARRDPRFNNINMITAAGNSNYNGLGVNFNKRFGRSGSNIIRGLQFNLAYTWGHALDNSPESGIGGGTELPQDSFNRRADYGNSISDVRHVFNASAVWRPRFQNRILNNNQLSFIFFARSGNAFDVRAGTDLNRDSVTNDRPLFVGRNSHKGPSSYQLDSRYTRTVRLSERYRLLFFAEAANVFNTPNPASENGTVNRTFGTGIEPVSTFGDIISFREMRRVQFGARFDF